MKKELKYGKGTVTVELDEKNLLAELLPNEVAADLTGVEEVRRSLSEPIGTDGLSKLAVGKHNVVIVTSDITRPVPSYKIIPSILDELQKAGVKDDDITVVFALGSHRGHTEEEKRHLVGDAVYDRVKCIDADASDCVRVGVTKAGTPVDIFRKVAEADFKICVGNIEFHYFAGYSGGAKAIMPGVSTREAIQCNHRMMVRHEACAGRLDGNPIREDIEESGKLLGIDYIVNVVLDAHKEIIKCVSRFLIRFTNAEYRRRRILFLSRQADSPRI